MTSINTNIAATTALRTLQSTNMQLDQTQSRISTGLKIGEAKDNAAYWSISTTLKSDNKALGTVKEALGLGAATVDVAYQSLNATVDVLNEIKAKIMSASQDNVDKNATQAEIADLQKQLRAIATSSVFAGENWLAGNSTIAGSYEKSIVSSFTRDAANNITLGSIKVDTRNFLLIDSSNTGEGVLDAGKSGSTRDGGLTTALTGAQAVSGGTPASQSTRTMTVGGPATGAGDLTFSVDIAGGSAVPVTVALAGNETAAQISTKIKDAVAANSAAAALVTYDDATNTFRAVANGNGAINITSINSAAAGATFTQGASTPGSAGTPGTPSGNFTATASATFGGALTLDTNDSISFDVSVNGRDSVKVRIDRETVNSALNVTTGTIGTAANFATVLNRALRDAGVSGLTAAESTGTPGAIQFTGASETTAFTVSAGTASDGQSILDLNIVGKTAAELSTFLTEVSAAIDKVTAGAAQLGAVAARVELQQSFVTSLIDTIDKGISGLIDADMNEESTRLQALQVKQQLGVQALSIANQSAQNVLRLFQ